MGKEGGGQYRVERDLDYFNQKLRNRKKYREQKDKDFKKKLYKQYKQQSDAADPATPNQANDQVDEKQQKFYKSLFEKGENDELPVKKKKAKKVRTEEKAGQPETSKDEQPAKKDK